MVCHVFVSFYSFTLFQAVYEYLRRGGVSEGYTSMWYIKKKKEKRGFNTERRREVMPFYKKKRKKRERVHRRRGRPYAKTVGWASAPSPIRVCATALNSPKRNRERKKAMDESKHERIPYLRQEATQEGGGEGEGRAMSPLRKGRGERESVGARSNRKVTGGAVQEKMIFRAHP